MVQTRLGSLKQSKYTINPKYNNNADLWSVGVLIYKAIYNRYPCENQKTGHYSKTSHLDMRKIDIIYHANGKFLSLSLVNLLCGLLEKDPNKRLSMSEFFEHEFIRPERIKPNSTEKRSVIDIQAPPARIRLGNVFTPKRFLSCVGLM